MASRAERVQAIGNMFRILEEKYGGMTNMMSKASVITASNITQEHLDMLFSHQIVALRVPGFYPPKACDVMVNHLLGERENVQNWKVASSRGLESSDVETVGLPLNMAVEGGDLMQQKYFADAVPGMRRLRGLGSEEALLSPVDKLRLELDEVWPRGCNVSKDKRTGKAHLAGLGRIMRPNARWPEGFCHVDDLGLIRQDKGLFSANIYLQTPAVGYGGELQIWGVDVRSRWDFYRNAATLSWLTNQDEDGQKILRSKLPEPMTLSPLPGELILLCAQRPHAVRGIEQGTRVSMQSFLTFHRDRPIQLDN